ncbi:MAG: FAD-dependent oxidoreductase [Rhodobacteraceae bacterium]|jgi:3-phenylpropionate/trans-cinnamate dioxygenase ferredoxin reductase subunit|uniref:NAD(P)/FAD-dependent oxidoreductase n=1 Tax=Albidovulum sp. TaxID=1872424 RepID=UPI001DB7FD6F|nr:FAD-dependent oxidoreductase [uncultured Defluviimonas sp.]MCB2124571.1 FAD-dependent oxidoreductase [Paracoccaceae bacterium]MCC0071371.1 FAD-dependent oxidoreductase [Paracoccaceae bacterium]
MGGIVIVGAGQAGASLAAKLRALGHAGPVTLIGEEPQPPYQRPPLSKAYLLGEMDLERLYLRAPAFWDEQAVTLRLGTPVEAIDTRARTVRLAGGETLSYDELALTTGSRPRRLPAAIGGDLANVFTVRTLADVDDMAPGFRKGARALIVGGGYIGLEAAAVAAKLGLQVTLIEAAPRILQRVASPETADYFRRLHEAHGVRILEGTGLAQLTGEDAVTGAILVDGTEIPADLVIVGIGILPNAELAEAAGIALENGIRTDELGRTSAPHVWAAGDCASFPQGDARIRLESVGNAIDMADTVAANILGAATPYQAKPWFWSDQYDVKLQIAGLNTGYDRIVTREGEGGAVSFWYYRGATLLALDAMNDARAYMIGKRLIEAGRSPDPTLIADPAADLKALLR